MGKITWKQAVADYEEKKAGSNTASSSGWTGSVTWQQAVDEYKQYDADGYKALGQQRIAQRQQKEAQRLERASVSDWMSRYNSIMQGVSEYDKQRNGGFTRDASGGFSGRIESLIADYEGIKGFAEQYGFQDSQKYLDQLKQLQTDIGQINDSFSQFDDEEEFSRYMDFLNNQDEMRTASLKDLTWNSLKRGYYNSLYGEESFKAMNREQNQKEAYEKILAGEDYQFAPGNDFAGAVSGAMELIGQQARQFTHPRTVAAVGAAGIGAFALGQAGPQVLAPEEVITVPGAMAAAFSAGSAASNLEIEAGHAYNEMLEKGISEETARKVAWGVGGVNAGLELLQADELLDAYKVTKASGATKTVAQKILDELLERGIDVAKETAQEVVQEGVTITGVQAASKKDTGEYAYGFDEVKSRLKDTAKSSALTFGLMNVPAAAKNTASIAAEHRNKTDFTTPNNATPAPSNATELANNSTPELSNATAVGEKSTPGGVTEKSSAVDDKMSATEAVAKNATTTVGVSKMETVQLTPDIESFSAQFGKQAEYVRRNFLEGQDLDLREDQDVALREYEIGFQAAFMIGKAGKKEALTSENVPYLSQSQREIAYQMGMEAAAEQNAAVSKVEGSEIETAAVPGGINRAVQISTGKPVEIAKISNVDGNGGMTFRLSDGRTVEASDIQYGTESESVLYESVADLGASAEVSNKLVNTWRENPDGVSAETYAAGMMEAFNYGRYSIPETEMEQSETIQPLTATQRSTAYQLGKTHGSELVQTKEANIRRAGALAKAQKASRMAAQQTFTATSADNSRVTRTSVGKVHFDRQGRTLSAVQETGLKTMEQLSQLFGTEFHVFESYEKDGKRVFRDENGQEQAAPNGWYDPETGHIHIDLNAGSGGRGTMLFTVAHEMTHFIRDWSPAKFDKLAEAVFQLVYQEQDINVIALVREQQAKAARTGRKMSFDEAYEEVVADSMESILTSGRVVELMAEVKQQDQSLWKKIRKWFQDLAEDIRKLIKAYDGYKPDSTEGRAVAAMEEMLPIIEGFYMDALQDASENYRAAEGQKNTTHKGDKKYSYAGENARTADLDQLATAKAMQQEGVSTETIRQQTGWFMGTDGKWRFEIDDSNMRVDQHGDARGAVSYKWALEDMESAREELWGHADMETLNNVRAYNRAILSGDTAEENRLHDLLINGPHAHNFSLYAEAREHVKEMSQKFGGVLHSGSQLADYVQHDALYEAYPQLQAASFRFGWLPDGTRGQYNPDDNSIIISNEIADSPERTIIHEIQHAIQNAEGFASGSSPEYWENRQRSGDSIGVNDQKIDAQMKHAQEILDSLPEDVAAEFRDWYDLNQRNENAGMVRAQELSSGQYGEQFNDYFMTTWTLEDLVKYNYSRGINDLYRNTAGEIEARDTANRWQAGLDAEGRKNTPPDLGDDKTVFTEGNVRSEQAIGRTADNKPFVIVERDILAGVDQSQWVKTVTNNIRNRFPNGVTIGRNSITINQRSRRELTYSEYMHKIKKEDPQLYSDKLRATDNLDEIIEATTNWISEGLKHERTDNIRDFARGNVLIRIGNNDYSAEVVVGTKTNGTMLLYDILNLQKTNISHKKTDASLTSESRNDSTDRQLASHEEAPLITGTHDVGETGGASSVTNINRKDNGVKAKESEGGNKYSQRDPLQEKAVKALEKENAQLKEDVSRLRDLVKLQKKLTGGKMVKPASVESAARVLKKTADATGDTKELAKLLGEFYAYIANGEELTWEGVKEAAQGAADWLWNNRKQATDEYSAEILRDLRTRGVSFNEDQKSEAAVTHDTFANYRKAMFGSVKITENGMPLDEAWHELSGLFPGVFPEGTNSGDMPRALVDIVARLRSSDGAYMGYDEIMARHSLIRDVYDSYWNVSTLYTVADVKQKEINTLKSRHAQRMSDLRTKHREKVEQLHLEQKAAVEAVRAAERQRSQERTKKALDKHRENQKQVAANRAERREKTEVRRKIRKAVMELDKLLNRGDKKKNVKDGMSEMVSKSLKLAEALFMDEYSNRDMLRNGVGIQMTDAEEKLFREAQQLMESIESGAVIEGMEFDGEIDAMEQMKKLDSKLSGQMTKLKDVFARERKRLYGTTVSELLGQLADEYSRLSEAEDGAIRAAKDENVYAHLLQLQKDVGGTTVRDMTLSQLEQVADAYTMVLTTVRNANKMFAKNLKFKRDTLAGMVMSEIGAAAKKRGILLKPGQDPKDKFLWNNLKPVYAFERLGSQTLKTMFGNIRKGQDVWAVDMQEADVFRREQYRKHDRKNWDMEKQYSFEFESGKVDLSLEQIMSLYAYSRRETALDHLMKGGFVFGDNTEVFIKENGIKRRYLKQDATAYSLTADELLTVVDTLSAEQKAFVEEMQTYLSDVMGGKGNEVSLQMYGIKSFGEKNYFPLRSAGQYMEKAKEDSFRKEQGQISIVNSGFTKATTPHASNPITLDGFMDVWAEHVNDMAMYHGFVLPMEDFRRVYNYSTPNVEEGKSKSVNAAIENAFGKAAIGYIDQLYKDLNGGAVSDNRENLFRKLVGLHKKAAVFASASVVIQQPSAFVRAFALVDPRHFIGPKVNRQRHKQLWAELKQYAPVAFIKEMGYFDTGMGKSAKDFLQAEEYSGIREKMAALFADADYRDEVLGKAPALADEYTWCMIWEAVKRETKVRNPGMDAKSNAFLQIAGERFAEVIDKTQVYDSVLSRSANMRSRAEYMNMLTSFMAEPTTSINMLEDALRKGDRKQIKRTVGAVYGSVLLNSLLVSLVYAARDDDEDETYWEKYLSSMAVEVLDGINPITYYPFLRDIWSIGQGYDVERADMSLITDFANAAKAVVSGIKAVQDADDDGRQEALRQLKDSLWGMTDSIANLTGVPVKNIRRDIEGARSMYQTISKDLAGRKTTDLSLQDAVLADVMNAIPIGNLLYSKSKRDQLYGALAAGDATYVQRIRAGYESDAAYHSAIKLALRENDSRIWEAAVAWNAGDMETYIRIAKEIRGENRFEQDDIVLAIRAEASSMQEKESSSSDKVYGYFTNEKFGVAMGQNNVSMADTIRKDLIDTAVANGKTRDEAEETVRNAARTQLKELYTGGAISAYNAEKMLVKYAGKSQEEADKLVSEWQFGMDYPDSDISFSDYQKWEDNGKGLGISLDIYTEYKTRTKGIENDKDASGKSIPYTAVQKIMTVINSLPLSNYQKDALARSQGWAETTIQKYKKW